MSVSYTHLDVYKRQQYASALAIDTAGETANGWYSLADWTVQTNTETGKAFVDAYRAAYNRDPDMQSVTAYDSMYLLKDAIERAGSDDPDAINKVLGETKDLPGAMTTYTFQGDNSLGTTTVSYTHLDVYKRQTVLYLPECVS